MRAGMTAPPPEHGPIRVTPSPEQAGQRIDRLLAEVIGTISRSRVKALIDDGALRRSVDETAEPTGVLVTEPSEPVALSAGIENWRKGTAVA